MPRGKQTKAKYTLYSNILEDIKELGKFATLSEIGDVINIKRQSTLSDILNGKSKMFKHYIIKKN